MDSRLAGEWLEDARRQTGEIPRSLRKLVALAQGRDLQFIFVKARKGNRHFKRGAELTAALLKSAN